jgi:hypothetical protein
MGFKALVYPQRCGLLKLLILVGLDADALDLIAFSISAPKETEEKNGSAFLS